MTFSRKLILKFLLCGLIAMPCISFADFWDGNRIKTFIDADDRMERANFLQDDPDKSAKLIGYVVGIYDTVNGKLVCSPENVKIAQLLGVVKKYVRENPDKWNRPAKELVIVSLMEVFPCK